MKGRKQQKRKKGERTLVERQSEYAMEPGMAETLRQIKDLPEAPEREACGDE